MLESALYVACINLEGRRVVVVGEGLIAQEKIDGLQTCGAAVEVVHPGDYDQDVLDGAFLVVAATTDLDLARRIFEDAERRAMLVNVADVPQYCNFILPAIARSGPITIAVSTAGASPALAKRIRHEASQVVGEPHARLAEMLDEIRDWAKANLPSYEARRDFFDGIVNADPDPIALLRDDREEDVRALIERARRHALGQEGPA